MINRTNVVLAAMLSVVVILAAVSGVDYSKPNVEVLADSSMKYTPASTPYEFSEVFANQMTQQRPIPGTTPRGTAPLYFSPLPDDVDPKLLAPKDSVPGRELANPVSLESLLQEAVSESGRDESAQLKSTDESGLSNEQTSAPGPESSEAASTVSAAVAETSNVPGTTNGGSGSSEEKKESPDAVAQRRFQASIDRGNDIFLAFCMCCHGPEGKGDGMVAQRGYPPPPSFLIGTSNEWNDGQLFHILTYGRANMPQFAAELPRENRWDVINYVRTLQVTDEPAGLGETSTNELSSETGASTPVTDDKGGSATSEQNSQPQKDDGKGPL